MDELVPTAAGPSERGADARNGLPVLRCRGLTKVFASIPVVDQADVIFLGGEIHGLVGQNGAGKSSLVKMLCGVYRPDDGHIELGDSKKEYRFGVPRDALNYGITMVAQELSLVPQFSVAENILLGRAPNRSGVLDRRALRREALKLIESVGFELDPDARVATLSQSAQQKTEILLALAQDAQLIILDEPTSSMSIDDAKQLYRIMRLVAARGTSIVLVSHFLEEVLDICDVVTVMRDGEVVARSVLTSGLTAQVVVDHMIGPAAGVEHHGFEAEVHDAPLPPEPDGVPPRLEVRDLGGPAFCDVSLSVAAGEIVALVGLVGSGRSEILRAVFGAEPPERGEILLDGEVIRPRQPSQAVRAGMAMITESRKVDGIFPVVSTSTNIVVAHPEEISRVGLISRRQEVVASTGAADSVGVRAHSLDDPISALSGGNQQKALLARWLVNPPRLFLIDEPTRGVDVVSIAQIHNSMRELARDGMSVLMVTSEFEEALELANRIFVVRQGRLVAEVLAANTTKAELVALSFGTLEAGE